MANFGGFLQALGQAFGGYAQDKQTAFARQQAAQRLGLDQRAADDAHLNTLLERATNYPFASSGENVTMGADGLPTGSINVPGYGTIDPFGRMRLGLMSKRAETQIASDAKIRESLETGATDKNKAETKKATAEADPEFAGQKAGAEEAAKFPWQQKLEGARYGYQNQLQNNRFAFDQGQQGRQHAFEEGQQGRQFSYDADKAARELAGNFANQSALEFQRQGNGAWSSMWRDQPNRRAPSQGVMPIAGVGAPPSVPAGNDAKPSLPDRIQQLKQQGLSKDRARLQLKREGYDLSGVP